MFGIFFHQPYTPKNYFYLLKNTWEYEQAKDMVMDTILAASTQDVCDR